MTFFTRDSNSTMTYSSIISGGTTTAGNINNGNGSTSAWGKMQKIRQGKNCQTNYAPSEDSTKWAINHNFLMKTNNGFNVVTHKGSKTTPRDSAAAKNQALTGPITMEHSCIQSSRKMDDDDEDFDKDAAFIRPPLDEKIEDKGA